MSQQTPRFGFSFFGGSVPGSLTEDGGKFTLLDPQAQDRILAALEMHDHSGGDRVPNPVDAPTAQVDATGGMLGAGLELHYGITLVDRFGLETAVGQLASVNTPSPVAIPAAPDLQFGPGGALGAGLYYYALTALAGEEETQLGPTTLISVNDGSQVNVTLPPMPAGADALRLWRRGPAEAGFTKIALVNGITFVDNGSVVGDPCACDPGNLPPTTNRTNATNRVTITLSSQDQLALTEDITITAWRLYRTEAAGSFTGTSLVAQIPARDAQGVPVVTYVDDEGALISGRPPMVSQTLTPSKKIATEGATSRIVLTAPGGGKWKLYATRDGGLATRSTSATVTVPQVVLTSPTNVQWVLSVTDDGRLTATDVLDLERDSDVYSAGRLLVLPTPDPTFVYALGVMDDGALTTTEV